MVEKNEAIRTYILNIANNLSVQGIRISDSTLENVMKKYFDSLEPLEEIFF